MFPVKQPPGEPTRGQDRPARRRLSTALGRRPSRPGRQAVEGGDAEGGAAAEHAQHRGGADHRRRGKVVQQQPAEGERQHRRGDPGDDQQGRSAAPQALADGSWSRLRRCPDCKLVFWDRTRNASKVWCGMYAGADGRACGSIAKVRRYRTRRAGTTS
jgi:predicted RNA-binding Zn ribbon-like protein